MQWIRSHLSFANVISVIALFVALGGASYAAVTLPKNSVGARQIKKNGVGASEIKKNAVRAAEIRSNAVGASEIKASAVSTGDVADGGIGAADLADNSVAGGKITDGSVGLADLAPEATGPRAFARVRANGELETEAAGQSRGVDAADIQKDAGAPGGDGQTTGPGVYCFGGLDFTPTSAVVALDNTDSLPALPAVQGGSLNFIPAVAVNKGPDLGRCNEAHNQIRVTLERVDQTNPPELVDHGFTIWIYG
jgi:hypothetical protein